MLIKYIIIVLSIFIWLLCKNNQTFSQTIEGKGYPFIRNYKTSEYNAGSQCFGIYIDSRGVIFVANNFGILIYDGTTWKIINLPQQSVPRDIAEGSDGKIYIGATGEIGYMAFNRFGNYSYISLNAKIPDSLRTFQSVWKVLPTSNSVYFVEPNVILRYNNDSITRIEARTKFNNGNIIHNQVIIPLHDGSIGLIHENKIIPLPFTNIFKSDENIDFIQFDKDNFLIISSLHGIYKYNLTIALHSLDNCPAIVISKFANEIAEYLKQNEVASSLKINENHIAIGTNRGGIVIMNKSGKAIQVINRNAGLQNNCVYDMQLDKVGNLWAVLQKGLSLIEINSPITKFSEINNLTGYVLTLKDYNKKRYVGTMDGIFYIPDYYIQQKNDSYTFRKIEDVSGYCWDIFENNNQLYAIGDFGIGIINNTDFKSIYTDNYLETYTLNTLFPDYIFFGTPKGLISLKLKINGRQTTVDGIKTFPEIKSRIRSLTTDLDNNIWISSQFDGLFLLKFFSQNIDDYKIFKFSIENGLPQQSYNFVNILFDKIAIGTSKGIYKINGSTKNPEQIKFTQDNYFGKKFTTDSTNISYIQQISDTDYICNVEKNLGILTVREDGSTVWNNKPFVKIPVYYKSYYDKNHQLWIFTSDGLYQYDSKINFKPDTTFQCLITKITSNNDSVLFSGSYYDENSFIAENQYYYKSSINQPKSLIFNLDYKYNSLKFDFSGTYHIENNQNQYQFILEGFDKTWSDWDLKSYKEYTNLPEGSYSFKVKSRNIYGTISTTASFDFKIAAPFYRTWYMSVLYLIIVAAFIYLVSYITSRRLKTANYRLEKIVNERTRELLVKNEEITLQNAEIESQAQLLEHYVHELERLSIVAQESDNAITIFDKGGYLEWINYGYTKLYGYTMAELKNTNLNHNIFDLNSKQEFRKAYQQCYMSKESVTFEAISKTKDGKQIFVQTTLTPYIETDQTISKYIAIDTDITKIKLAELEIMQKNEEITAQKEELQKQNDKILHQRDQLALKNQQIQLQNEFITGSIRSALLIQDSILPRQETISCFFENFIVYKPKDIVSGDFYWFYDAGINNETNVHSFFIAVVDCTGHGVPGAFMSFIGNRVLNETIHQKKIMEPHLICEEMNLLIKQILKQENDSSTEGMDLIICRIDANNTSKYNVVFTGAKRPLIYYDYQQKTIKSIKGERKYIGGYQGITLNIPYTSHILNLTKNDVLYLTTDGFIDQNNSNRVRFGTKQLHDLLLNNAEKSLSQQQIIIEKNLTDWMNNQTQRDDITIVGIKL